MRLYLSSFHNGNQPEELIKLVGNDRRTALIANAMDVVSPINRAKSVADEIDRLKSIGLDPVEIDLRSYFGKPAGLKEKLAACNLIWVRGGNSFVLRRAFQQSGADIVIAELLREDGIVYGAYSAGIDMLAPSLHGVELVDDPHAIPEGYNAAIVWECLGLLPYVVAPHYKSNHPESAAIDKSVEYLIDNHMPFIALRDGQVIIINGASQRVVD